MDSNTYETLRSPHANQRACTLLLILEGNACIFQQGNRELKHHLNSTRNNRSELDINMNFQSNRSDVMTYPSEGSCYSIFSIICMLCRSCFVLLYFFLLAILFFFDIRILITPLVSSNSSRHIHRTQCFVVNDDDPYLSAVELSSYSCSANMSE